jgi:hypothetical protein
MKYTRICKKCNHQQVSSKEPKERIRCSGCGAYIEEEVIKYQLELNVPINSKITHILIRNQINGIILTQNKIAKKYGVTQPFINKKINKMKKVGIYKNKRIQLELLTKELINYANINTENIFSNEKWDQELSRILKNVKNKHKTPPIQKELIFSFMKDNLTSFILIKTDTNQDINFTLKEFFDYYIQNFIFFIESNFNLLKNTELNKQIKKLYFQVKSNKNYFDTPELLSLIA